MGEFRSVYLSFPLCWSEGVIWVVGGEIGNLVPWGGVSLHCAPMAPSEAHPGTSEALPRFLGGLSAASEDLGE